MANLDFVRPERDFFLNFSWRRTLNFLANTFIPPLTSTSCYIPLPITTSYASPHTAQTPPCRRTTKAKQPSVTPIHPPEPTANHTKNDPTHPPPPPRNLHLSTPTRNKNMRNPNHQHPASPEHPKSSLPSAKQNGSSPNPTSPQERKLKLNAA